MLNSFTLTLFNFIQYFEQNFYKYICYSTLLLIFFQLPTLPFLIKILYRFYYTLICMNRLYSIAFKRILTALNSQQVNPTNVEALLDSNKIKPIGSFVFHRLARQQLRNFVKTPCPVQSVEGDNNKAIIKSSKSLRASFGIQQEKVCNRCPHKQICPEFSKPGQQNHLNAFSDLLVFMQAMNNNAVLEVKTQKRVWMSGYKACDSILATIEDLKKQAPQSLEYQKIRLQFVVQKQQRQGQASVNEVEQKDKKKKQKDSNKKQTKKEDQGQIKSFKARQGQQKNRLNSKKIAQQEDDLQFSEEYNVIQEPERSYLKGQRRQKDKMHRLNKSSIPPNNFDVRRKKTEYFERPEPRDQRQNRQRSFDQRRQDSNGYQSNNRQKYGERQENSYNERRNSNYRQQRDERRPQRDQRRPQRDERRPQRDQRRPQRDQRRPQRDQRRPQQNQYRQNRSAEPRQSRQKVIYNERKQHKKQLEKQQMRDIELNSKFESAGKIYKNQKLFETWGQSQVSLRNERPSKIQRPRSQVNPQEKIERQFKTQAVGKSDVEGEKKRGRRVKK